MRWHACIPNPSWAPSPRSLSPEFWWFHEEEFLLDARILWEIIKNKLSLWNQMEFLVYLYHFNIECYSVSLTRSFLSSKLWVNNIDIMWWFLKVKSANVIYQVNINSSPQSASGLASSLSSLFRSLCLSSRPSAIFWGHMSLSCVQLVATLWTMSHQAPPSMGFFRQEYWSGWPFPSLR